MLTCETCSEESSVLFGGQCEDCHAKTLEGHFACKECGKHYHSSMTGMKLQEGLCFTCNFWYDMIAKSNNPDELVVRVDGTHYVAGPASRSINYFGRGFGGRCFNVLTTDGRLFSTNNLWCQGTIPNRFRDRLPNNANFVDLNDDGSVFAVI